MDHSASPWPSAIVFDLDGTLIDSAGDIAAALNKTMEAHGIETPFPLEEVKEMIGGGVPTLIERAVRAKDAHLVVDTAAMVEDFMRFYEAELTANTQVYEGARELLGKLKAEGKKLGLCTNKPHALTLKALGELDLLHYFDSVQGEREGLALKPHPDPLLHILRELKASAKDALYVGDSIADVACARAAGVKSAVLAHGYSRLPAEELGADYVLASLKEVPDCWQKTQAS